MNLRDLKYLVAVADNNHFGKAANKCFVSQPALSIQLQKLEGELGVKLFERSNKKVLITQVGKDVVARARKLLQEADEIKSLVKNYHDPFATEIKLGAFPTLAPYFLPNVVTKINDDMPNLKLLLVEEKTEQLLEKIKQGEIDAAFLALPVEDDSLEYVSLFEDEFLLTAHKDYPLAKKTSVKKSDISDEELLLLEDGHCLREQALEVCDLMKASERQDFRATSLETLRQMVASGVGITLIPRIAAQEHKDISYIPFKKPKPSRTIALVWRKTSTRKECLKKVSKIIKLKYD